MRVGLPLAGVVTVAAVVVFLVALYRMAGIKPAALERRRLAVMLAMLTVFAIVLGVLFTLKAPGVQFYGVGVAVASL